MSHNQAPVADYLPPGQGDPSQIGRDPDGYWYFRDAPVDRTTMVRDGFVGNLGEPPQQQARVLDVQLKPLEDGMYRGEDGGLHAYNVPGSYKLPDPAVLRQPAIEVPLVRPRNIAVADRSLGPVAVGVSVESSAAQPDEPPAKYKGRRRA